MVARFVCRAPFSVVLALNLILEYRSDRRLEELYESKYLTTLEKLFVAENELDRIRRLCPEVDAEISGP